MSVIVKGMKMPDCCASCPLLEFDEFAIDGYKDHWCNALDIGMSIDELPKGRRSDCPLTELIRCKDCKWYKADEYEADYGDCTLSWGMCNAFVYGNDYCSQAERKPPQVNPERVKALLERIEKQRGEYGKTD